MDPWIWTSILLIVGIIFAMLELFIPSGGILAFFSFASFCASVVFAFHQGMIFGFVFLGVLLIGLPIMVWQLFEIWPHTYFGKQMLLDPESDPALTPTPESERYQNLVGMYGVAKSRMMPSGTISLDNILYDAVSEGEPIDPGTHIIVVKANQMNIIVRPVPNDSESPMSSFTKTDLIDDPF